MIAASVYYLRIMESELALQIFMLCSRIKTASHKQNGYLEIPLFMDPCEQDAGFITKIEMGKSAT